MRGKQDKFKLVDGFCIKRKRPSTRLGKNITRFFLVATIILIATVIYGSLGVKNCAAAEPDSDPRISIAITNLVDFSILPGGYNSGDATVMVNSTNNAGYELTIGAAGGTSALINETHPENVILAISERDGITEEEISNGWGVSIDSQKFYPVPEPSDGHLLLKSVDSVGEQTFTLTFAARVSDTIEPGSYVNDYIVSVIANPSGNSIIYDQNTEDEVLDMPDVVVLPIGDKTTNVSSRTPLRDGYEFIGWDKNPNTKEPQYTEDDELVFDYSDSQTITLYAIWEEIIDSGEIKTTFNYGQTLSFDGTSYLDTNMELFSSENYNMDFTVSTKIESISKNSSQSGGYGTIISEMDETGKPYPGFVFRSAKGNTIYEFARNSTQQLTDVPTYDISDVSYVEISRNNHILDIQTNADQIANSFDSTGAPNFNIPLTFGAAIDGTGNPFRYFKGELSNSKITSSNTKESGVPLYITLPTPTMTGKNFVGWYENKALTKKIGDGGDSYELKKNTVFYAKWENAVISTEEYHHEGQIVFDGTNYIDTDICLFSYENFNRDFVIAFNVDSIDGDNPNLSTIMNALNESSSPYPGFVMRTTDDDPIKTMVIGNGNGRSISTSSDNIVGKITIFRIGNAVYYKKGEDVIKKLAEYNKSTDAHNIQLTLGAALDSNKSPFRFFKGAISDIDIRFVDEGLMIEDFEAPTKAHTIVYQRQGNITFDGSNYLNTGIYLFNQENYQKDFTISFNIVSSGENVNQSTLVASMNESGRPWPGIVLRTRGSGYEYIVNNNNSSSTTKSIPSRAHNVIISRKSSMYYMNIDGAGEEKILDASDYNSPFDAPLVFGAGLDGSMQPFRYFNGTISDIVVKME